MAKKSKKNAVEPVEKENTNPNKVTPIKQKNKPISPTFEGSQSGSEVVPEVRFASRQASSKPKKPRTLAQKSGLLLPALKIHRKY